MTSVRFVTRGRDVGLQSKIDYAINVSVLIKL